MKTVIMAGGKGTRISPIAGDIPKPMVRIGNKPVLEHEMECLREQGFTDILLTVGHLGRVVMDYFGDGSGISPATGRKFGVHIEYYAENEPLGSGGALFRLRDCLKEDFLLLNGDVVFDVDFVRFAEFHRSHGGLATLFTHPNSHPYDSGIILADGNHAVRKWLAKEDEKPVCYCNRVNAGLHIISPALLDREPPSPKVDLDREVLKPLAGTGKMFCYDSPEYVKDMGTPDRYEDVCRDFEKGVVRARNLRNRQKAVFLDRDGTINRYVGFLRRPEELELLENAAEAVRKINDSGYLTIVVTNQPVLARGEVTREQLGEIHDRLETLLGRKGAYLDAIYYCPHHPDRGFPGEVPEWKAVCSCRKPEPGMLLAAAEKFNIDLGQSWMVGDSERDIRAGQAAGCGTALIHEGCPSWGQTETVGSLWEFAERILT